MGEFADGSAPVEEIGADDGFGDGDLPAVHAEGHQQDGGQGCGFPEAFAHEEGFAADRHAEQEGGGEQDQGFVEGDPQAQSPGEPAEEGPVARGALQEDGFCAQRCRQTEDEKGLVVGTPEDGSVDEDGADGEEEEHGEPAFAAERAGPTP